MLVSKRQINEITLSVATESAEKFEDIIDKFGSNVKKLNLNCSIINDKQLIGWINRMPMLEEINFEDPLKVISVDHKSTLKFSKMIKVTFKNFDLVQNAKFIQEIPNGVIKEFSCTNLILRSNASTFLPNSFIAKRTKLGDDSLIALNQSNYEDKEFEILRFIFSNQQNLTSLTLKNVHLNDDLFEIICGLKKLEYLNCGVDCLAASSLKNIEHLTNLKSLLISDGDKDALDTITNLKMPKLELLGLLMFPELDDFWSKLDGKFSGIKKVKCGPCFSLSTINTLMRQFPYLESLKMAIADGTTMDRFEPDPRLHFIALKNLLIGSSLIVPTFLDIMPIVNICENVEELTLYVPQDISLLKSLLLSKKRLRKLGLTIEKRSAKNPMIGYKIIEALEGNAPQLRLLFLKFKSDEWNLNVPLDIAAMKRRLIDRFPFIRKDVYHGCPVLLIKKRGEKLEPW